LDELSRMLGKLASPPRLELGTYCLEGSCSILLSYRDEDHSNIIPSIPQKTGPG
jgi:hypothetical protein